MPFGMHPRTIWCSPKMTFDSNYKLSILSPCSAHRHKCFLVLKSVNVLTGETVLMESVSIWLFLEMIMVLYPVNLASCSRLH